MKRLIALLAVVLLLAACTNVYLCSGDLAALACVEVAPVQPAPTLAPTNEPTPTSVPTATTAPTLVPTATATPAPIFMPSTAHAKLLTRNLVDEFGALIVEWVDAQLDASLVGE